VGAPVGEVEAGSDEDVFDGTGGEHLVWVRERTDPGSDVHGETGDGVASEFNLARVYADPGLEFDAGADVDECARAPHGVAGNREDREDPVAGRLHDPPAVGAGALGEVPFVAADELTPTTIAHLGGGKPAPWLTRPSLRPCTRLVDHDLRQAEDVNNSRGKGSHPP
jgi:hypothetical protein